MIYPTGKKIGFSLLISLLESWKAIHAVDEWAGEVRVPHKGRVGGTDYWVIGLTVIIMWPGQQLVEWLVADNVPRRGYSHHQ